MVVTHNKGFYLFFNFQAQGHCVCKSGFIGESCSVSTMTDADSNKWFTISSSSQIFHPRTAHSVVYSEEKDVLLSFGGVCMHVNEPVKFLEL